MYMYNSDNIFEFSSQFYVILTNNKTIRVLMYYSYITIR